MLLMQLDKEPLNTISVEQKSKITVTHKKRYRTSRLFSRFKWYLDSATHWISIRETDWIIYWLALSSGGGDSHRKVMEMLIEKFQLNP